MKYSFHIVDVFSRSAFGGNQLAVLPEASGISPGGMQKIAREFNFAEATFVLPAEQPTHTRRVRIFTPKAELPFAGHPTVGTACALVMRGHVEGNGPHQLILEEGVGPVSVHVEEWQGVLTGTLTLSNKVEYHPTGPRAEDLATVLSLQPSDVAQAFFASVGLGFCFVHLASRDAVDRAVIDKLAWAQHLAKAWSPHVFFFAGDLKNGGEIYARMCAPALGIEEDPATGSACAALVGAMATRPEFPGHEYRLAVQQGVAMGRRSDIDARARKSDGGVLSVSVGGATTYVASGEIDVPREFLMA
jgi:trans-2,3-dihydro-3-hydroxyanthranilate isomerase